MEDGIGAPAHGSGRGRRRAGSALKGLGFLGIMGAVFMGGGLILTTVSDAGGDWRQASIVEIDHGAALCRYSWGQDESEWGPCPPSPDRGQPVPVFVASDPADLVNPNTWGSRTVVSLDGPDYGGALAASLIVVLPLLAVGVVLVWAGSRLEPPDTDAVGTADRTSGTPQTVLSPAMGAGQVFGKAVKEGSASPDDAKRGWQRWQDADPADGDDFLRGYISTEAPDWEW